MAFKFEDIVIEPKEGISHLYQIQPYDVVWRSYDSYDGDAKLGQIMFRTKDFQGIVTKITYDREKKWWQFWIRRKQTGCYVEWREK